MNLFKLVLGDWGKDGHEKTDEFVVRIFNGDQDGVLKALAVLKDKHGIDFKEICRDFEDNRIPDWFFDKLEKIGVYREDCLYSSDIANALIMPEEFAHTMILCLNAVSTLNLEIMDLPELKGYGYGLFYL